MIESEKSETETVRVQEGEPVEAVAAQLQEESDAERAEAMPAYSEPAPAKARNRGHFSNPAAARAAQAKAQESRRRKLEQGQKPRRGRPPGSGRRKAQPPPTTEPIESTPGVDPLVELQQQVDVIAPVLHGLLRLVVDRRYPDRPYTMSEARALAAAAIPVAAKYDDGWLVQWLPELVLASVCIMQFGGRAAAPELPVPVREVWPNGLPPVASVASDGPAAQAFER
jgi:hypothetical protein